MVDIGNLRAVSLHREFVYTFSWVDAEFLGPRMPRTYEITPDFNRKTSLTTTERHP